MKKQLIKFFKYISEHPIIGKIFIFIVLISGIITGGLLAFYVDYYYCIFSLISGIGIIIMFFDKKNWKIYKKIKSKEKKEIKDLNTTWEIKDKKI